MRDGGWEGRRERGWVWSTFQQLLFMLLAPYKSLLFEFSDVKTV